jgi:hypothetical protein
LTGDPQVHSGNQLWPNRPNTLGHTIAVINIENDANTLVKNMPVGGLATDVKIAGRWGIVSGQETGTVLNQKETGHGLPTKNAQGVAIKNNGSVRTQLWGQSGDVPAVSDYVVE